MAHLVRERERDWRTNEGPSAADSCKSARPNDEVGTIDGPTGRASGLTREPPDQRRTSQPDCAAVAQPLLPGQYQRVQSESPLRTPAHSETDRSLVTADIPEAQEPSTVEMPVVKEERRTAELSHFGDYDLLHVVGRGGMGVVFKARQISLNRIVAIKMIMQGRFATAEDVERFHLEAQAVAKLEHPYIVVIHEVGRHGDQRFFSMEYVEGQSLADLTRHGPLPPKRAARYALQVAEAVHFAHQQGVLHRDIKPSNVIVDAADNARVMDFGLAKHVDRSEKLTVTGQILGTPSYMAPEQITNRPGELSPACDIYGIGALLYELLTLRGETSSKRYCTCWIVNKRHPDY